MPPVRALAAAALAGALFAGAAATAQSRPRPEKIAAYCSRSGDLCYGVFRKQGAVFLDITTFARYFARYRLCVDGPRGAEACRSFAIRARGPVYGSSVRWHTNFPREGRGVYRVAWRLGRDRLGPTLTFRLGN